MKLRLVILLPAALSLWAVAALASVISDVHLTALPVQQEEPEAGLSVMSDLVFATAGTRSRMHLWESTTLFRKGLRTYIAVDPATFLCTNSTPATDSLIPIENVVRTHMWRRAWIHRKALAPLLAHEASGGQYKWMLYGDDDTLWVLDKLTDLLQDFDHSQPYWMGDSLYWRFRNTSSIFFDGKLLFHGMHSSAPRCAPCHYKNTTEAVGPTLAVGCPCTWELACTPDPGACGEHVRERPFVHGGSGQVMSRGLFEAMDRKAFRDCVDDMSVYARWSDTVFSRCMYAQGFAITDPSVHAVSVRRSLPPHFGPVNGYWGVIRLLRSCLRLGAREPKQVVAANCKMLHGGVSFHLWDARKFGKTQLTAKLYAAHQLYKEANRQRAAAKRGAQRARQHEPNCATAKSHGCK